MSEKKEKMRPKFVRKVTFQHGIGLVEDIYQNQPHEDDTVVLE